MALPDQDSFYDVTDKLELLGMEAVIRKHMNNKGTEPDLRTQFTIYEVTTRNGDLNTFPFLRNTCCLQTDVFFSESLGESALPAGPECCSCPAVVQPLKTFTVINKKSWLHLGFLCILHNIPTLSADTARFRMCVHSDAASVCNEQQSQDLWR